MAKKSSIENNKRKAKLVKKFAARRKRLLDIANNEKHSMEERFEARLKLSLTAAQCGGRPRAQPLRSDGPSARLYRKFKMSRIALRELGNKGLIPGLVKSSW